MKKFALGVALLAATGMAQAQDIYVGGGLSNNDLDGWSDSATGFQIFGGYGLDMIKLGAVKSAVEVGYMDSGDFEDKVCINTIAGPYCVNYSTKAKGLWANYVASMNFTPALSAIGRVGLDFGDDDGFMFGAGLGFNATKQLEIRGEYVVRDHINSLQANVVYHLK